MGYVFRILFVLTPFVLAGCQVNQFNQFATAAYVPNEKFSMAKKRTPVLQPAVTTPSGQGPELASAPLPVNEKAAPTNLQTNAIPAAFIAAGSAPVSPHLALKGSTTPLPKNEAASLVVADGEHADTRSGATKALSAKPKARPVRKKKTKRTRRKKDQYLTIAQGRKRYGKIIAKHAKANGVPYKLALAIVYVESSYRPNARGSMGEIGLMQLMPTTARYIGYKGKLNKLYDPDMNIRYGMKYLGKAHRLGGGSLCGTILKYNAGHGAKKMNRISRRYCNRIKRIMRST